MSAILAVACPEAAMLITDGAGYDDDGILRRVGAKVTLAQAAPFAVATRGNADIGDVVQQALCHYAASMGPVQRLSCLPDMVRRIGDEATIDLSGDNGVQVVIAAWTLGAGGQCFAFHTGLAEAARPAFELYELPSFYAFGPSYRPEDAATVPAKRPDEAMTAYMRRAGADIIEVMRRKPGTAWGSSKVAMGTFFGVGGRCDLTTVDRAGARLETLRVWNDKIGCKVDPFGVTAAASPLPSRQQRRAMARDLRKRAG